MKKLTGIKVSIIVFTILLGVFTKTAHAQPEMTNRPNVLILYTDDLGYGDLGCYGAKIIATPRIDALAAAGLKMTNAHATASTCTPSRFSLLSGRYAWRKKGTNILPGNANLIIPTDRMTLPKVFKKAGYLTGVVGKWHLGLGNSFPIDWNHRVSPGPKEVGFDYSFIFPATADRTPTVYLENQEIVGLDPKDPVEVRYDKPYPGELTGKTHPEMLKLAADPRQGHDGHIVNGIGRIGFMQGGKKASWTDEELGADFNDKAIHFMDTAAAKKKPFFLYYAIQNIHVPRMPSTLFKGKSPLGYRGDVIAEMDHTVGVIMDALAAKGLLDNTLVIFSSDNGPVLNDGYLDDAAGLADSLDYRPGGVYSGGKYSALEAGTRVPFIVYWKGHVPGNSRSGELFSQMDMVASFAKMLSVKLPDADADWTDSRNHLDVLLGQKSAKGRETLVEQAANGTLGLVKGNWKYIAPGKGPALLKNVNIKSGYAKTPQLYNLKTDPQEKQNLAGRYPKKVKAFELALKAIEAKK